MSHLRQELVNQIWITRSSKPHRAKVKEKNIKMFSHEARCCSLIKNQRVKWEHSTLRGNEMMMIFSSLRCFKNRPATYAKRLYSSTWSYMHHTSESPEYCGQLCPLPPISHHFSFNTPVLKDNKYTQMRDISIKSVCGETFIEVRPSWREASGEPGRQSRRKKERFE